MSMKRLGLFIGMVVFLASSVVAAAMGENIIWLDKSCFQVGPVKMCKPNDDWDMQKTRDHNARYKFVLHRTGPNPMCWLRFDENPSGKTAKSYAGWLEGRLSKRGLSDLSIRKETISGRNVSYISGQDTRRNFRYLVGVWRNQEAGVNLECKAATEDFALYESQFRSFITSAQIISELAL